MGPPGIDVNRKTYFATLCSAARKKNIWRPMLVSAESSDLRSLASPEEKVDAARIGWEK